MVFATKLPTTPRKDTSEPPLWMANPLTSWLRNGQAKQSINSYLVSTRPLPIKRGWKGISKGLETPADDPQAPWFVTDFTLREAKKVIWDSKISEVVRPKGFVGIRTFLRNTA
ncbi:hypothetical protein CDAR_316521 [Caerostris darwini]|uniref:Uncharacterized protein n=1 Tax=Caerostris darwini TaxID=1538125 RepID=A0AAV4UJ23_9ARAC|nr:hypothetical protein CDAR_316521 [Caerostris darwini]